MPVMLPLAYSQLPKLEAAGTAAGSTAVYGTVDTVRNSRGLSEISPSNITNLAQLSNVQMVSTANGHGHPAATTPISSNGTGNGTSDSKYLAKPSGECCLKGTIHKGEPRGSWLTIAGVETYMSKPAAEKANGHVLMYFPDVSRLVQVELHS
jgi:hypothetical protein